MIAKLGHMAGCGPKGDEFPKILATCQQAARGASAGAHRIGGCGQAAGNVASLANILDILGGLLGLTLDAKEACPKLLLLLPPPSRCADASPDEITDAGIQPVADCEQSA